MIKHTISVTNPFGLHSRICSNILKISKEHHCQLTIVFQGKSHQNDSILMLMQSGIVKGNTFEVTIDGEDDRDVELKCSNALKAYIELNLGELRETKYD